MQLTQTQERFSNMKQLTLVLKNEPGSLSGVCDALDKIGININSLTGMGLNHEGVIHFVTTDEKTAQRVLEQAGYKPAVSEVMTLRLKDSPGELAKALRKLGHAKVNIDAIYLLERAKGEATIALKV